MMLDNGLFPLPSKEYKKEQQEVVGIRSVNDREFRDEGREREN